jgi:multidrug transporter EmrE-like cation transporter
MTLSSMLAALASISLTSCAQVALREAMLHAPGKLQLSAGPLQLLASIASNPYLIGGVALYGISILLWLYVLSQTQVSVAYPLSAIGFILTAVIASVFLNEQITFLRLAGIMMICFGVVLVSRTA